MKFGKWTTPTLLLSCSFHAPALLLLYSSPAPASALPLPYSCPAPAVVLPCSRQAPIRHIPNSSPGPAQLLPNRGREDQRKFVSAWKVLKVCSKEYIKNYLFFQNNLFHHEQCTNITMVLRTCGTARATFYGK